MNTILNLTNLKFFNDNGQELHSEKDYVIQWKLLPCDKVSKYFQDTINGYFLADIKYIDGEEIPVIDYTTIVTGFINNGGIFIDSDYKDILADYTEKTVNSYIKEIFFNINNDIELSITVEGKVYKYATNVNYIFDQNNFTLNSNNHIVSKGENATSGDVASDISNINDEYYELLSIESIGLQYVLDDDKKPTDTPILYYLYLSKINNLATLYPFVHYQISYIQDKVSVGFIAANALLILQKTGNNYHSAYLDPAAEHSIITFLPSDDSEIKIFESDNYEIKYKEEESYDLCDNTASTVEPIVINFCFQADEEGAYQNFMGMYIRTKHEPQHIFFFGTIIIKTEVEGEDERFRTLLTNFGIPDPKYYSNIFAEADYEEESTDYTLINNKSKELFLSYDQIFPYVGTYKALKNAIKFLGYNDIIFKEWYRIQDSNDQERDIAVQCIDTDGNYIKNTLDNYGISLEDFDRYNKLNKLTMIYHINKIADDNEDAQTLYLMQKNELTGLIENTGQITKNPVNTYNTYKVIRDGELQESTYFDTYDIPTTEPIFTYSSEVVLAKLNSVKEWLEKHIIGVNAYIQEITGEGIYIHRFKNQAYITEHSIQDFQSQGIYTPNIKQLTDFTFSEATLGCSLNEYKTLTFDDYQNVVIEDFDFREIPLADNQIENIDVSVLKLGNIPILIFVGRTVEKELATGDGNINGYDNDDPNFPDGYKPGKVDANEVNWYGTLEATTNKKQKAVEFSKQYQAQSQTQTETQETENLSTKAEQNTTAKTTLSNETLGEDKIDDYDPLKTDNKEVIDSILKKAEQSKPSLFSNSYDSLNSEQNTNITYTNSQKQNISSKILNDLIPKNELEESVVPSDTKGKGQDLSAITQDDSIDDITINSIPEKTAGAAVITNGNSEPIPNQSVVDEVAPIQEKSSLFSKIASIFGGKKNAVKNEPSETNQNIAINQNQLLSLSAKGSPLDSYMAALKQQIGNTNLPDTLRNEAQKFLDKLQEPVKDLPSVTNWLTFTQVPMSPTTPQALALHQWAFLLLSIRFSQLGKSIDKLLKKGASNEGKEYDKEAEEISKALNKDDAETIKKLSSDTLEQITRLQNPTKENLPLLYQYIPLPPTYDGGKEGGFNAQPVVEEDGKKSWHLTFAFDLENLGPIEIRAVAKIPELKLSVVTTTFEALQKVQEALPHLKAELQKIGITTRSASARLGQVHLNSVKQQESPVKRNDGSNLSLDIQEMYYGK